MQAKIQKIEHFKYRLWWRISIIFFMLACFPMVITNSAWAAYDIYSNDELADSYNAQSVDTNALNFVEMLSAFMAGSAGMVSIDSIPAGSSGTVTLPVRLEQAEGIGTATILVYYDDSLLRVNGCITDPYKRIGTVLCNEDYAKAGVVPFNIVSTGGFSGDTIAAEISFEIIGTLKNSFVPKLEVRRSATDVRGVDILVAVAEANQIGTENDALVDVLEDILQVFLPIVQK